MQLTSGDMGSDMIPRPRKVDAGSFADAAKLVTIDICQRSSKKSLTSGMHHFTHADEKQHHTSS